MSQCDITVSNNACGLLSCDHRVFNRDIESRHNENWSGVQLC